MQASKKEISGRKLLLVFVSSKSTATARRLSGEPRCPSNIVVVGYRIRDEFLVVRNIVRVVVVVIIIGSAGGDRVLHVRPSIHLKGLKVDIMHAATKNCSSFHLIVSP